MAKPKPQETDQRTKERAAKAVAFATQLIDNWEKTMRTRFNAIREYEENYLDKVRPRSSGRSNFPVPVLARYLDEIHSRLDETPVLKFDSNVSISRKLIARKATAMIQDLRKPSKGNWNKYDRIARRHAEFAGPSFCEFFSETVDGEFRLRYEPIHHTEVVFEIGAGNDLEKHAGVGRFPIWRTKSQLESRAKAGVYSEEQVKMLSAKYGGSDFKRHLEFFQSRTAHLKALGIDVENNSYAGQPVFPLAQMQLTMDFGDGDERWLLTFDYLSGVWLRFQPLKEVFPSGMYSIDYWQSFESEEPMCKSACDDIFPFAEGMRVKVNQLFDNHTKRIYGQRGYDPNFVPNPAQLIWRDADQLTKMKSYNGKPISQGIYEFKSEDMTASTISFLDWMDKFLTSVVGINPNDVSDETQKVGILFGQLQKTAARFGSQNKSFNEMWSRNGYRALHEMAKFLDEPQAIQIIGTRGVEWDHFVGAELGNPADFDILTEGSNIELEMSEARKKAQGEAIDQIIKDPDLKKEANPRALVEFIFRNKGQFKDEEVVRLMDNQNYGNEDMLARADLACEEIVKNVSKYQLPKNDKQEPIWHSDFKPKLYRGADTSFAKYILDFAEKLDDDELDKRTALIAYARAHKQIIIKNMAQKTATSAAKKGMPLPGQQPPAPGNAPPGGPPMPSPELMAKVKARGARPIGHMPIPQIAPKGAGRMPSMPRGMRALPPGAGAPSPQPPPVPAGVA